MSRSIVAFGVGTLLVFGTILSASDAFAQRASGQTVNTTRQSSILGTSRFGGSTIGTSGTRGTAGGHQGATFGTSSAGSNRGR